MALLCWPFEWPAVLIASTFLIVMIRKYPFGIFTEESQG